MIESSLALGLILAVAAACCYDGGYALQAFEARRAPVRHAMRLSLIGHLLRRPIWVGAIAISILGWVLQLLALARAPLTLVQPTLALGLLLLLALGVLVLHEPVGRREIAAVAIIIGAVGVIAWAAPAESGEVPRNAGLALALGGLGAAAVAPFAFAKARLTVVLVLAAGAADGLAALVSKLVAEDAGSGDWMAAALWAVAAGVAVLAGLVSESSALQRAPATRVAPAVLVLQISIPVVLAPVIGGESWSATPLGGAVIGLGLGAVSIGVLLLAGSPLVAQVVAEPGSADDTDGDAEAQPAAIRPRTSSSAGGSSKNE